jgi:hypothetical protein
VLLVTDKLAGMVVNRIRISALVHSRSEELMKTLLHFRTHDHFHAHPFHSAISLMASFALTMLVVLLFVATLR